VPTYYSLSQAETHAHADKLSPCQLVIPSAIRSFSFMNLFKILPLRPLYGLSHPLIQACYPPCYPLCGPLFLLFTPFRPRIHLSPLEPICFQPCLYLLSLVPICYLFSAHLLTLVPTYYPSWENITRNHLPSLIPTCYLSCPRVVHLLSLMSSCPPAHLPTCSPSFPSPIQQADLLLTAPIYLLSFVIMPTFYPLWSPVASHVDEEDANRSVDVVVVLTVQIIQARLQKWKLYPKDVRGTSI
jgi:hypothetical protein